jgi:dTDP-4-dehydrorhamnose 3,5-epimerase
VFYLMGEYFHPESSCGVRWNDPSIGIRWPEQPVIVSAKDRSYPLMNTAT